MGIYSDIFKTFYIMPHNIIMAINLHMMKVPGPLGFVTARVHIQTNSKNNLQGVDVAALRCRP